MHFLHGFLLFLEVKMKILVIGGGIVGSLLTKELSKYENIDVTLVEANYDLGAGVTKANSAILHGGYDDEPGTLRAKLCARGNKMYDDLVDELGVPVQRTGSLVVSEGSDRDKKKIIELYKRGIANGVSGMKIVEGEELRRIEPYLSPVFKYGLYCSSAGITEPWITAINSGKLAELNGAEIVLGDKVVGGLVRNKKAISAELHSGEKIQADIFINCAGLYYEEIAKYFDAEVEKVLLRKGEYLLLDKAAKQFVNGVIFPLPTKMGKGKLVLPTIDGGVFLGPTSKNLKSFDPEDLATTRNGLEEILKSSDELVPGISKFNWIIKSFAGLRPETEGKDFIIKRDEEISNFITVGGIRSPGLTAAPAISEYVINEILNGQMNIKLIKKEKIVERIPAKIRVKEESFERISELIEKDELYGRIICQCNQVSEREIVDAIHSGARTIESVKLRTRAGFGRCQGGFCTWKVAKIISRETGIELEKLIMNNENSYLLEGKVR